MERANEMAKLAIKALEDKKGEDIHVIDIREVSVLADYFLIASGSNVKQVQAMADSVEEVLGRAGVPLRQIEGYQNANWILMDYGDIIVHVFCREDRLFYDLERIWRDGKIMDAKEFSKVRPMKQNAPLRMRTPRIRNRMLTQPRSGARVPLAELYYSTVTDFARLRG